MYNLRFSQLTEFKQVNGNCRVPYKYKENQQLADWVRTQRSHYQRFIDGKPSPITKDRIKKLDDIGFTWTPRKDSRQKWLRNGLICWKQYGDKAAAGNRLPFEVGEVGIMDPVVVRLRCEAALVQRLPALQNNHKKLLLCKMLDPNSIYLLANCTTNTITFSKATSMARIAGTHSGSKQTSYWPHCFPVTDGH